MRTRYEAIVSSTSKRLQIYEENNYVLKQQVAVLRYIFSYLVT